MNIKLSRKQQINAELASRHFNQKAKEVIKSSNPVNEIAELVIDFVCECSNKDCTERVPLTIQQYEKIHTKHSRFVLATGHEQFPVDKVRASSPSFTIVDKPALSSATD